MVPEDPIAAQIPDQFLDRAISSISAKRGDGWAELFLERTETIRAGWDSRAGLRFSPGIREGFAVRWAGSRNQEHRFAEGLDPDRILATCREDSAPPLGTSRSPSRPEGDLSTLEEETKRVASALETTGSGLLARIPSPFSLSLKWRRRRIRVASSRSSVRSDATTRVAIILRLLAPSGEVTLGIGAADLPLLLSRDPLERLSRESALRLEEGREGREAPEGETVVILAPGTGGVFFHEACGHALEGDLVLSGASVFRDLLGKRVAPDFVGAMDDSSQPGLEGSYGCDDEGSPCRGTIVIARGVLRAFLTDRMTGECLGRGTTANGRRESFRDLPLPRMSNTFLMAAGDDPEEIVKETPRGVYVERLDRGRVDTATGEFVFRAGSGHLVEAGRLTAPLRPFSIAGNGLRALETLDRVGSDLSFGTGAGSCGKEGQEVPVAVGQPTIRLPSLAIRPG